MAVRDLWEIVLNHLPFREEADLIAARKTLDDEFPRDDKTPDEPEKVDNRTPAGVKNPDGSARAQDWTDNRVGGPRESAGNAGTE